jgi:hypothetical protein
MDYHALQRHLELALYLYAAGGRSRPELHDWLLQGLWQLAPVV